MSLEVNSPVSAKVELSNKTIKTITDSTELEPCQSKIVEVNGKLKKLKFLIVCDGNGNIKVRELKKWADKLKELEKMKKFLTDEQYRKMKQKIIDDEADS